tara:strand:- start:537 stop:722 length:186 start_codon:yes stop_codon:yes gene_type:complete
MKLNIKEIEYLEDLFETELYIKNDDLRRYENATISKPSYIDIIKELKSDIKILNSIRSKII